ncbi:MAG: Kae1-associated serine/threonine protein kinase [Candidatus Aenigmarchaeota archaeon]|nr:Kae1-associated serine/threonine protein kinase [Candidatus Aenigmarchaeota archaeon]
MEIVKRGAEAVLYLEKNEGETVLVKERLKKGYRIGQLDGKIRKERTQKEARLLDRALRAGVNVPRVVGKGVYGLKMSFVEGRTVKDALNGLNEEERFGVYRAVGEEIARMHSAGIMHGDVTTSNMIISGGAVCIIDFGLGRVSSKTEDQAVDLYVLHEALKAAHYRLLREAWGNILKAYGQFYSGSPAVLNRLEKIEQRRRYK